VVMLIAVLNYRNKFLFQNIPPLAFSMQAGRDTQIWMSSRFYTILLSKPANSAAKGVLANSIFILASVNTGVLQVLLY